ncbi:hypothetical protein [Undibacter mobilis]|uniref:hypothetical protein n=1 Tax=Undibacter mobilis TaxID=2292256 RepID=UPI001AEC86DF|nr:hypothetical protein [Undibacter mobilis]
MIEAIVMIASAARFNIPVTCLEERHWRRREKEAAGQPRRDEGPFRRLNVTKT